MKKQCAAYINKEGEIHLTGYNHVPGGPWFYNGCYEYVAAEALPVMLLDAVRICIDSSKVTSETDFESRDPDQWKALLRFVGVKNQRQMVDRFRSIEIESDGSTLSLVPTSRASDGNYDLLEPHGTSTCEPEPRAFYDLFRKQLARCR